MPFFRIQNLIYTNYIQFLYLHNSRNLPLTMQILPLVRKYDEKQKK
jgi:hypothetical protein